MQNRGRLLSSVTILSGISINSLTHIERRETGEETGDDSDTDDQPVIVVIWYEARLFCRWRGSGFRLPTEKEWERAASWDPARGVKRKYPWGDEFDPARCNTLEAGPDKTTPVGAYPDGVSACGCYDMAGNVWEWTGSLWKEKEELRVVRGGSWGSASDSAACSYRQVEHPLYRGFVGFRCARS